jgi:hypothetical protein
MLWKSMRGPYHGELYQQFCIRILTFKRIFLLRNYMGDEIKENETSAGVRRCGRREMYTKFCSKISRREETTLKIHA